MRNFMISCLFLIVGLAPLAACDDGGGSADATIVADTTTTSDTTATTDATTVTDTTTVADTTTAEDTVPGTDAVADTVTTQEVSQDTTVAEDTTPVGDVAQDVDDATVSMGACDNDADQAALAQGDPAAAVGGCAFSCFTPSPTCTMCLQNGLGTSDGCTECFAQIVDCTVKNCATQCIADAQGPACTTCRAENCNDDFEACAGIEAQ